MISFKKQKIHFMGIGGIGMSAIANLALEAGARVSGCDLSENSHTKKLVQRGVTIYLGHRDSHLSRHKPDILVYSSAVPPGNTELVAAQKMGVTCLSRAAMLARLMADKEIIAITGSHGKTTTTWIVADVLMEMHCRPSVMIGGVAGKLKSNFRFGAGKHFVTEVDESDGSLLNIHPQISLFTNIDLEHLDYYRDWAHLESVFSHFVDNTCEKGCLIGFGDDKRVRRLLRKRKQKTLFYGFGKTCDIMASHARYAAKETIFDLSVCGEKFKNVRTTLSGQHNLENILGGIAVAKHLNLDSGKVLELLAQIETVKRRFEFKGQCHGAAIVEDYAHHPREVSATLSLARLHKPKRLIGIFQPHRYSRLSGLWKDFVQCFDACDELIVMDVYSANESPIENINAQALVDAIRRRRKFYGIVHFIPHRQSLLDYLNSRLKTGDMAVFMGAGDIGRLAAAIVN